MLFPGQVKGNLKFQISGLILDLLEIEEYKNFFLLI